MDSPIEKARELKALLDRREIDHLRPLACFSSNAVRRKTEDKSDLDYRQGFSADADRILNSMAFTRYIDKTQVFSLIKNDHLTHRIIHVQLVSRIARTIGRYLGLNQDLIEAASLGHDIGHPPFGHDGERFLAGLTKENGAGYFHHNIQSIQFLDRIERNGKGWNLTLQTQDAIISHNGEVHATRLAPHPARTFDDLDRILCEMPDHPHSDIIPMTMEGCVVRMADTISYIGRDLEDAIRLKLVERSQLPDKCRKTLGQTNGTIVFTLVTDLINSSLDKPDIGFSEKIADALKTLKEFNYERIYKNPVIKKHLVTIGDIFRYLFEKFLTDLENRNTASMIYTDFLDGMAQEYCQSHSNPQIVRDYIAGMTDSYFIRQAPEHLKPDAVENV